MADLSGPGIARGQRLWAVLLVLDSFFVIVFGGALAAKIYQHWGSPSPAPSGAHRKGKAGAPGKGREEKAQAGKPAAPETKPAEPPKAPGPPPSAQAPTEAAKPPKPSLLQESPKPHEAAKPQETPQSSAASAPAAPAQTPPGGKLKAVPTEFTLKHPGAKSVELAGAFIVRGGRKHMVERSEGVWTITVYLTPNTYRYHFIVNGKRLLDPENPKTDRGASVITVP